MKILIYHQTQILIILSLPPARMLYVDQIYDALKPACHQFSTDQQFFYTSILDMLDPLVAKLREKFDDRASLGSMYIRSQDSFDIEFKSMPTSYESRRIVWMKGFGEPIATWHVSRKQNYPKPPIITLSLQNIPHIGIEWILQLPDNFIHTLEFHEISSIDYKQIPWNKIHAVRFINPQMDPKEIDRIKAYLGLTYRWIDFQVS